MEAIKVLLADDHKIFREGIISLLKTEKEIEIVAEANNGNEVLEILKTTPVDVVLLDINMPKMSGIETATLITKHFPSTRILVFSSYDEDLYILKMIQIGVAGYVLKTSGTTELIMALKAVSMGDSYYCKEVSSKIRQQFSRKKLKGVNNEIPLTERELEIMKLVAKGLTNAQIGERLFISPRTVDTHRRNLLQKLNLHSAVELTRYAIEHKL